MSLVRLRKPRAEPRRCSSRPLMASVGPGPAGRVMKRGRRVGDQVGDVDGGWSGAQALAAGLAVDRPHAREHLPDAGFAELSCDTWIHQGVANGGRSHLPSPYSSARRR